MLSTKIAQLRDLIKKSYQMALCVTNPERVDDVHIYVNIF